MDGLTALGMPLLRRSVIDDVTGKPVITSPPTGEVVSRSNLLPLGITDEGRMTVALPQAVLGAYDAALFPGQVLRGEKGVFDPATGHVSQEAMDAANRIAGIAMTGSLPFGAPKGALRMFGGAAEHADDPLAALETALSNYKPEAPAPGPRLLDPNAKSWDVYHGSNPGQNFERFDPSLANNPAERGAVFFAPNPDTASGYAGGVKSGAEAGSRVYRATVEPGMTGVFDLQHLVEHDPTFNAEARSMMMKHEGAGYGPVFDDAMADYARNRDELRRLSAQADQLGYAPSRPDGVPFAYGHIGAAVQRAKDQGLDTAILRGLGEHGGDDQVIALTPGRVRSYYAPDQLLYSGGPGGALAALGMAPINSGNR